MNKIVKFLLLAGCITSASTSFALPEDYQKTIDIEADSAFIDNEKGNAIYIGNVNVSQGSILISANKLTITSSNSTKKYDKIYAKGTEDKVANFSQQLDLKGDMIISRGTKIFYDSTASILEVEGAGYIKRGEDEITADFIRYDMTTGTFEAKKNRTGRVSMTLQPQSNTTKAE
jgi:lipopolysaccharide export system protein LptA